MSILSLEERTVARDNHPMIEQLHNTIQRRIDDKMVRSRGEHRSSAVDVYKTPLSHIEKAMSNNRTDAWCQNVRVGKRG